MFEVINYKDSDLKKIDVKTRKLLAIKIAHQQKAETERPYLPIKQGGRGLLNVEYTYKAQIVKYKQYLKTLHGRFPNKVLDQSNKDKELSFKWIKKQQMSPTIESAVFAIQEKVVMTQQHQCDILKDSRRRRQVPLMCKRR
ncbi:unnamed protein product [Euphydryas editha]|uniref:Uncharacterized protein n=1 Tax=Euphydryas editha TaxID=104508 RepID=A0AAU9U5M9_EUPED|nr:unnamed protein product [Euphydryas editha]